MERAGPLRMPIMWLVIGLPVLSIVAGVGLVVVAVRSGSTDAVIDPVQRTAQIQVTELGPDARAQALKLSAVLRVGKDMVELLPVGGGFGEGDVRRDEPLTLVLSHPSEAAQDRTVILKPSELGWRADIEPASDHDWLLQLSPADGSWRLRGRLPAGQQAAHLAPALADD
ncbi:FixH family protein [Lysobacter sp. S4-A87]|uniref:FixH family protein n=1 Tax=Lysobacter sp. S4-A87 TaxID=2925843 RepID=UPI001F533376|nr:FixH family protein [Lysobacter sp. S4-A87]UNK48781.1 FixH family protein [Lysobacter sp. S4-A87]